MRSDATIKHLGKVARVMRTVDKDIARAYRAQVKQEVLEPVVAKIKAADGPAPQTRIAKRSVRPLIADKPLIRGGGGRGLPAVLFGGSEFGSYGTRRTTYFGRGPNWRGTVTRRTTRQFKAPFKRTGYFFFPTILRERDNVVRNVQQIAYDAVKGLGDR